MRGIRQRLTYANVMATLAFFIAVGGGAYAAFKLPKNSVKSDNIVNGQVKYVDLAAPGKFKSAGLATMNLPTSCGGAGAPQDQWVQFTPASFGGVGYYRDIEGYVHLQGWANKCGDAASANVIFVLPPGYRPGFNEGRSVAGDNGAQIGIETNGNVDSSGSPIPVLSGIEFRCAPSGANGCP